MKTAQACQPTLATAFTAVLAAALLASLAACGGGAGDDEFGLALMQNSSDLTSTISTAATVTQQKTPAPTITLQGCVVDEFFIPRSGTVVRLLGADGRLLGHASSNNAGVFSFTAPAQQSVSMNVDKIGGETLVVPTGRSDLSVGACLSDPNV
jgi:hypothetical protein